MKLNIAIICLVFLLCSPAQATDRIPLESSGVILQGGAFQGLTILPPQPYYESYTLNKAPAPYDTYVVCIYDAEEGECVDTYDGANPTITLRGYEICASCDDPPCNRIVYSTWKNSSTGEYNIWSVEGRNIVCVDREPAYADTTNRNTTSSSSVASTSSTSWPTTTSTSIEGATTISSTSSTVETTSSTSSSSSTTTAAAVLPPPPVPDQSYFGWDAVTENCNGDCTYDYCVTTGDTMTITYANIITNGTFAEDSGWTKGSTWAIEEGVAKKGAGTDALTQSCGIVAGHTYLVSFDITDLNSTTEGIDFSLGGTEGTIPITLNYVFPFYVTATDSSGISFTGLTTDDVFMIDNIVVYDLTARTGSTSCLNIREDSPYTHSDSLGTLCSELGASTDGYFWVRTVSADGIRSDWSSIVLSCDAISTTTTTAAATSTTTAAECTPAYGDETYADSNAIKTGGDANATTGFTNSGMVTFSSTSDGTPHGGTYHISVVADTAGDKTYKTIAGLSADKVYKYSVWAKHNGTGADIKIGGMGLSKNAPYVLLKTLANTDTTYSEYSYFTYFNTAQDTVVISSASTSGGAYIDDLSIKEATTLCLGAELFAGTAASTSEADSIGGFLSTGGTAESVSTGTPHDGTYHLHFTTSGTSAGRSYIALSGLGLEDGHKYMLSYWAKNDGTGTARCSLSSGTSISTSYLVSNNTSAETTYTHYGLSFVAGAAYRYFVVQEDESNNISGLYIDGFSIKEILDE